MDNFRDRLVFLFGKDVGPTDIAKIVGMTYPGFSRVWYQGSIPKVETMINIQNATGCDLNWLLTGHGAPFLAQRNNKKYQEADSAGDELKPMMAANMGSQENDCASADTVACGVLDRAVDTSEFVYIPRYQEEAAERDDVRGGEPNALIFAFRRYWVENYLQANPKDLSAISVRGDSMMGVLNDGDNILANRAKNQPGDGLYVIRIGESVVVKQTQRLPGNRLLVKSTNNMYQQFTLDLTQLDDDFEIIGKVEWSGHRH